MINIKKFIDKVSACDARGGSHTLVIHLDEARMLRDEIAKLMADNYQLLGEKPKQEQVIQVELNGGKW